MFKKRKSYLPPPPPFMVTLMLKVAEFTVDSKLIVCIWMAVPTTGPVFGVGAVIGPVAYVAEPGNGVVGVCTTCTITEYGCPAGVPLYTIQTFALVGEGTEYVESVVQTCKAGALSPTGEPTTGFTVIVAYAAVLPDGSNVIRNPQIPPFTLGMNCVTPTVGVCAWTSCGSAHATISASDSRILRDEYEFIGVVWIDNMQDNVCSRQAELPGSKSLYRMWEASTRSVKRTLERNRRITVCGSYRMDRTTQLPHFKYSTLVA
jgi:hypothetical protein